MWNDEKVLTGSTAAGNYRVTHSPENQVATAWDGASDNQLHLERWSNCEPVRKQAVAKPIVGDRKWGGLRALAYSDQPLRLCALGAVPYYSSEFISICADILQ